MALLLLPIHVYRRVRTDKSAQVSGRVATEVGSKHSKEIRINTTEFAGTNEKNEKRMETINYQYIYCFNI